MRQRNDTPDEVHAWTDPVLVIAPGDIVEHEHPLTGLTILDDEESEPKKKTAKADSKSVEEITP